jgi:hypothetical protein
MKLALIAALLHFPNAATDKTDDGENKRQPYNHSCDYKPAAPFLSQQQCNGTGNSHEADKKTKTRAHAAAGSILARTIEGAGHHQNRKNSEEDYAYPKDYLNSRSHRQVRYRIDAERTQREWKLDF